MRQDVILLSREEVLVNVMVGRFEGVVVSVLERLVAEFEEEDEVEDERVLSGEERPRARRRRDESGIASEVVDCARESSTRG